VIPKDKKLILALKMLVLIFVLYRIFSLDIYAVTPNDSIRYLREAVSNTYFSDPLQIVQLRGFKFPGYPIYLSIWHNIAPFLPLDGLTLMALSQRLLLAASLVWLLFNMGFFSVPLLLFYSSNTFLAQSNIIYTEGMTIPLAILFSISMVSVYRLRNKDNLLRNFKLWLLLGLLLLTFILLVLTKLTHAAFALPLLMLGFTIKQHGYKFKLKKTKLAWPVTVLIIALSVYTFAVSIDNKKQFGKFTPIMGHERLLYFGLWNQVFFIHPENIDKPELAEFYDNGSPYVFLHRIDKVCDGIFDFPCTAPFHKQRTSELLAKSKLSLTTERIRTAITGLLGGQKTELNVWREGILKANGQPYSITTWHSNWYIDKYGMKKYLDDYNRGETPRVLRGLSDSEKIIGKIGVNATRLMQAIMTVMAITMLGWFVFKRKIGFHTVYVYSFVAFFVFIVALSSGLMDLWRFIIPCWSIFIVCAFYAVPESWKTKQ